MHVASLQKQVGNSLHMCDIVLYMKITQGLNKRAMDYHRCEHVTEKLSLSPESDYNLSCDDYEGASQFNSLSNGLYAVELCLCCGLCHL